MKIRSVEAFRNWIFIYPAAKPASRAMSAYKGGTIQITIQIQMPIIYMFK
jgi:hypothetical protein